VWAWSAAAWGAFGVVDGLQEVVVMRAEGMHHPWLRLFLSSMLAMLPWAIFTPAVVWLTERFSFQRWKSARFWAVHLLGAEVIGFLYSGWAVGLDHWLNPFTRTASAFDPWREAWRGRFVNGTISFVVLYGMVMAVTTVLESRARLLREQAELAQLNEQLAKARLDAVRRQIEPHFLFNTLNAVSALVRDERKDDAVTVIAELSEFLRRVLEESGRQEVPLREEMDFAARYLRIQQVRFEDRLRVRTEVSAHAMLAKVPTLMVQTLVENAIKHGIAKRVRGGEIRISAHCDEGVLELRVGNDGPSLEDGGELGSGIGIANLRARLESLYGSGFVLRLENTARGVDAVVRMPMVGALCE